MLVEVVIELTAKALDKTFTYAVPPMMEHEIALGKRVIVPFGRQKLEGFILKISELKELDYKVKDIIEVIDSEAVLNQELLELGKYMKKKTLSTLVSCYQTMLPRALKAHKDYVVPKKYEIYYQYCENTNEVATSKKQQELIDYVKEMGEVLKKELVSISASSLKTLEKKGILIPIKKEVYRLGDGIQKEEHQVTLTEEQKMVIQQVLKNMNTFSPYLLHGVTGSGKTEVYMQLIEDVIKRGKEAIVLVPEISLTPQMVSRFQNRFGHQVAILHSRLSAGEKYDEWRKIERREVSIVIGARSAIFAPFTNLGMVIVDEEHSTTYKQENMPKYHAIDMALKRAQTYQCPIILGSATPSLESYTRAKLGVYQLLEMNHRVNDSFPKIEFVNMKEEIKAKHAILSRLLTQKIQDRLDKKEQVILLLNKRGYARVVTCKHCGYVDMCPNCDIPFIYHKETHMMQCHYCGSSKPLLRKCPSCGETEFQTFGMGTEKLEELVKDRFQEARILRMDVDTTSRKGSHEKMIDDFSKHKYDILIGTQMIAKGLDFEKVTLVGVLEGDNSLNIPDFRSAERTFQLLNQVSGRAGRGSLLGEVVIQGFQLDHYSIVFASKHDYIGFYQREMNLRKKLDYPPYSNLTLLQLKGKDDKVLLKEADKIKRFLKEEKEVTVLGPSFASIPKINQIYTIQIILKYKKTNALVKRLSFLIEQYATNKSCKLEIDINPIRM